MSSSDEWSQYLGAELAARLVRSNRMIRLLYVPASILAIALLALWLIRPIWFGVPAVTWSAIAIGAAFSYSAPLILLRRQRVTELIARRLERSGLGFHTPPPVTSARRFSDWLQQERLEQEDVRDALMLPS